MRFWLLILLVPFLLAGCSNNDDSVIPPSPLPQFKSSAMVKKRWAVQVGRGVEDVYMSLKPAVTERWVYAAARSGRVVKVERDTGRQVWRVETGRIITGGVGAGYGRVAVGTDNGDVLVLSEEDGSLLWEKALGGQIMSAPAMGADRVVVQSIDGRLHGLVQDTGAVAWIFDTSIPILTLRGESHPVVMGDATLAGFANGKLVALDTSSGFVGWERLIGEAKGRSELERLIDLDGRFWISGKTVYAATYQGNVAAIDIPSGRLLWQRKLSSFAGVSEFLGQLYVVDDESVIHALESMSGTNLWQQDALRGRGLSAPTAYNRYLVVGDYEGYLHWLSYRDGSFVARVKAGVPLRAKPGAKVGTVVRKSATDRGLRAEPVVYQDIVYVQTNSGELAAYEIVESE